MYATNKMIRPGNQFIHCGYQKDEQRANLHPPWAGSCSEIPGLGRLGDQRLSWRLQRNGVSWFTKNSPHHRISVHSSAGEQQNLSVKWTDCSRNKRTRGAGQNLQWYQSSPLGNPSWDWFLWIVHWYLLRVVIAGFTLSGPALQYKEFQAHPEEMKKLTS